MSSETATPEGEVEIERALTALYLEVPSPRIVDHVAGAVRRHVASLTTALRASEERERKLSEENSYLRYSADALQAERDEWEESSTSWQGDAREAQCALTAAESRLATLQQEREALRAKIARDIHKGDMHGASIWRSALAAVLATLSPSQADAEQEATDG